MDLGSQVGTENPIRSDQIQVRSGQIRPIVSGQAGSGEVRSVQVRTNAILENPSGSWRGEGLTRHEGMGPPQGSGTAGPRQLGILYCAFLAILAAVFFSSFCSMPLLIDFGSFLPPNLAPKINQNR